MIIDHIKNFIQRIIKNSEDDFYTPVYGCSRCGYAGILYRHGSYYRNVICEKIITRVRIQRVICPSCHKTHAIIPSNLIPYYQHTLLTVLKVIELVRVKRETYTQIIESFSKFNSCFCKAHINFYLRRFNRNYNKILYYFRTVLNYNPNPPNCEAAVILEKINKIPLEFNKSYFNHMPKFFLSK